MSGVMTTATRQGVLVVPFTCGWMTLPAAFFLDGESGSVTVPATAYLIDHPDGLALFDTGLGPRFLAAPDAPARQAAISMGADDDIASRLRAIGVDPSHIRWVINSHLHTDHAGGNVHLPNATVIVQDVEWDYALSDNDRAYHKPEFDIGQKVKKISGEFDLFGDGTVLLFTTTGHTPGHQSARIRTAGGEIVLAADCCNMRRSLDELRLPDHCFDADQYMRTLQQLRGMRDTGTHIFYGHDSAFWSGVKQNVPLELGSGEPASEED